MEARTKAEGEARGLILHMLATTATQEEVSCGLTLNKSQYAVKAHHAGLCIGIECVQCRRRCPERASPLKVRQDAAGAPHDAAGRAGSVRRRCGDPARH